ncbi:OmpH family outer membrane protein [Novosphingobium humi]|uniref:OmpH family outer membrane protein n=1 Tax=Novosphingobium humi TaxID=2282397 RepID=A0ABY7TYZ4_9SPHN|nr:OmpH family outer membrane protein [Novosphingobium humi]WCT78498.1 OmpH family outer membrane protein [Novosphingobium humi]WJS97948.1 OmpH family outer membrane protein [Novosphingobium humi]
MKTFAKIIALAALAGISQAAVAAPAAKSAAAAPAASASAGVNGVAVANLDAVVANSLAFKKAQADREVTYKAQLDAAKAKEAALNAQIKPIVDKFQKDRAAPGANVSALAAAAQQQVQQIQEQGKAEIEKIVEPVRLSDAYVLEQIMDKRAAAVQTAMSKAGVTLLLNPEAILAATNAYNLNQQILTELNTALPSVQIVPPAGWQPREAREAAAQQQQQAPTNESR